MNVLYVMRDRGVTGCCKIGKDTRWPRRYIQARCHTPRGIAVSAVWKLDTSAEAAAIESAVKRELAGCKRPGHVNEWFDAAPSGVLDSLAGRNDLKQCLMLRDVRPDLSSADRFYDDWRERRESFMQYRWRVWLFAEDSPEKRLKISYGALYDTAYRYAFTYNPFPVYLIGGFETEPGPTANKATETAWNDLMSHPERGMGINREEVGWLKAGATPALIERQLSGYGLRPFDLTRPKPADASVRDASVAKIEYGQVPPLGRVRAWKR